MLHGTARETAESQVQLIQLFGGHGGLGHLSLGFGKQPCGKPFGQ